MLVVMCVSIAGADFAYQPGQTVDLPEALARTWLEIGHARLPAPEAGAPEAASTKAPERAARPPARSRKG